MRALAALVRLSLVLNARNRMALLYGYVFPLVFLIAFWAIYRSDPVPLVLHLGQFLTITVLGSACFGLPTTIVAERERGVWRRYRLSPAPRFVFIAAVLVSRALLLASAVALQLLLAFALGMPLPAHPGMVALGFVAAAAAFLSFGLVIAMLVDNVPAMQALGQCLFLPMLMVGGVAVRVQSLPDWAQHLSVFLPGRYAVEAMQLAAAGGDTGFDLIALTAMAAAGIIAAAGMFRWDRQFQPNRAWLLLALAMWLAVGAVAETRGLAVVGDVKDVEQVGGPRDYAKPRPLPRVVTAQPPAAMVTASWQEVTAADIDQVDFGRLPSDAGIVSPVARPDEEADAAIQPLLDRIAAALPDWPPGAVADPVQRARNLLVVAAVPDLLQMEQVERFVPRLVFARLQAVIPPRDLPKILYWVALHPDGGDAKAMHALADFGLPDVTGPEKPVRGRVMLYAFKLLGRLTGHIIVKSSP